MRRTVILAGVCLVLTGAIVACGGKKPAPNAVTVESGSVTVDSVAPDTSLVVIEDTTVTVGIVTDGTTSQKK